MLRLLASGPAAIAFCAASGRVRLDSAAIGVAGVDAAAFEELVREGQVATAEGLAFLTEAGKARQETARACPGAGLARHAELAVIEAETPARRRGVAVNLSESPLAQLARRRVRDGAPFLSPAEFDAGERLRSDYTRGQLLPRVTANWDAAVATGRRGGFAGGRVDLTEAALAARVRVNAALGAVGPELAGVLVDVCCFLKGLETVEAERGWPARSAKVVLKTALAALARHYAPPAPRRERAPLHWGAAGYRPSIRRAP